MIKPQKLQAGGAARLAAEKASVPVTVLDSGSLSIGLGFLAWTAAQVAAEGHSTDEIVALLEEQGQRTHIFAALDTLEFLRSPTPRGTLPIH